MCKSQNSLNIYVRLAKKDVKGNNATKSPRSHEIHVNCHWKQGIFQQHLQGSVIQRKAKANVRMFATAVTTAAIEDQVEALRFNGVDIQLRLFEKDPALWDD